MNERTVTDRRVVVAGAIGKQAEHSICCVETAPGVTKKRRPANGRILLVCVVEERSGAESGVELALYVAVERIPSNCCIVSACIDVETQKGVLAFCCLPPG